MNILRRFGVSALVSLWLCGASTPSAAADYAFSFASGEAQFRLDGDNRAAFDGMLSLLRDFHGAAGFRFTLVGGDETRCTAGSECKSSNLFMRRIDAIVMKIGASPDDAPLAADLRWRADSDASANSADRVRLVITTTAPPPVAQCPYDIEMTDPRLPSGGTTSQWVPVSGLAEIYATAAASLRVRRVGSADVAHLYLRKKVGSEFQEVTPRSTPTQWTIVQVLGTASDADLAVGDRALASLRGRGVAEDPEAWPAALPAKTCDVHLVLRR